MNKRNYVALTSFVYYSLVGFSISNEICRRSADSSVEYNDVIHVLLHTRPYYGTPNPFNAKQELGHRWAFVFLFTKSQKILTYEGAVVDGHNRGCSYNHLPASPEGSTLRLLGNISGYMKYMDELSRKAEKELNYPMDLIFYTHYYVTIMAKMIGNDIWDQLKNSKTLFESVDNLFPTKIVRDYESLRNLSENYINNKQTKTIKSITLADFKCIASLSLYAFEATLIPYMLKQGPLILLAYSFAIDFQATMTYEYINKSIDTLHLSDLMKLMVTIAKSLYFCLHWISGTVHALLVLRFTISVPKIIVLILLCCEKD